MSSAGHTRPARVFALVTDAFGGAGGIAQYNRDLLSAIQADPSIRQVEVLPRSGPASVPGPGLRQHDARRGRFRYSIEAAKLVRRFSPDVLFCGHLYMLPLAAAISRWRRVPLWLQIHGIEAWACPNPSVERAIRRIDIVTSVSRYTRSRFLTWANLEPEQVRVLPNTVRPRYRPGDRVESRRLFGLTDDQTVLLTVGRMAASEGYKGHDRVLDCLAGSVPSTGLTYLIAGDGDDADRLRSRVRQLGLGDIVRFLGRVPEENLADLYRSADLFVMPSTGEGFGIVFLEAMASGTMALGLSVDGSADALRDGTLGRMARPDELCEAISNALGEPNPPDLATRTLEIFGEESFRAQVRALIERWWPKQDGPACVA